MSIRRRQLLLLGVLAAASASLPLPAATAATCRPTPTEEINGNYVADAPARRTIGKGHVLVGVVRSSEDCRPIVRARIELFQAGRGGEYATPKGRSWPGRSAVLTGRDGSFRFQGPFPGGSTPHIHLRVTAPGHQDLNTTYITRSKQGRLELVLVAKVT